MRFSRWKISIVALLLIAAMPLPVYALEITVKGLFKDAAVLQIDGQQQMLKKGQRSPQGVLLVEADTRHALVEYAGERRQLTLSRQISTRFSVPDKSVVAVPLSQNGSYFTRGQINGRGVEMLIDTGATSIALNSVHARKLGINYYRDGRRSQVSTASGLAEAYGLMLQSVKVGEILVHNVPAVVVIGDYPREILLGMSYLQHVSMREDKGVLYLEQK
jgi:aspartyl protease family protein